MLRGLQRNLVAAATEITAITITVPDHWPPTAWALPQSLVAAGWQPVACIREGLAVLAALDQPDAEAVLLVSLGAGSAYGSYCTLKHGFWRRMACHTAAAVSGIRARRLISDWMAQDLIQRLRRDVREWPQEDQALQDAIESSLHELAHKPEAWLQLSLAKQQVTTRLTWPSVSDLARPMLDELTSFLKQLLSQCPRSLEPSLVLVWGELAGWPPVVERLQQALPQNICLRVLAPHAVAFGAARLCARGCEGAFDFSSPAFAALNRTDGRYLPSFPGTEQAFALLEQLPVAAAHDTGSAKAWLVCLDAIPGKQQMPVAVALRLGRDPNSDWLLPEELYPEVSRSHAVLRRQGKEFVLCDLKSTNGTYLNGKRIDGEALLADGDIITLGSRGPRFRFQCASV